ncbi:MAG: hypothetical protein RLO50_08580 [Azospirillaceae bacterium]
MAASNANKDPADLDQIRADLDALRKDVKSLVDHIGEASSEGAKSARKAAKDGIEQAGSRIEEAYESGRDTLRTELNRNPLLVVGGSFLVGLLIGRTLFR